LFRKSPLTPLACLCGRKKITKEGDSRNSASLPNGIASRRKRRMAQKKISEILKLVEFLNEEVREVSKRLSRITPREVTEKLGTLALLREKVLNLQVELPQDVERKLTELYPAIDRIKQKPS
jgi:hypothetical protein